VPKVTQLTVPLANKPGSLAKLCSTLSKAGVNITAVLSPESGRTSRVRVLVDDRDKAKEALKGAKVRFSEEDVIALELDDRPGAIGEVAEKLAKSKINIKYAYATTQAGSTKATLIFAVQDVRKALGVLTG
jgi:hypothetical protein